MKNLILTLSIFYFFSACNNAQKPNEKSFSPEEKTTSEEIAKSDDKSTEQDGYTLMKQFCFSCHMETPDPSKHDQMIAPPMANVKEHYISTYPDKDEFIKAVVNWVNKPDENKVLMPGAVRRFNLMPPLPIGDDKLKAIAEALYEKDFGTRMGGGHGHGKGRGHGKGQGQDNGYGKGRGHNMMGGKMQLNNGQKWKLAGNDFNKIQEIQKKLQQNDLKDVNAYRQLGKDVFNSARSILLNKDYKDETLQQVQIFFHNIEEDMHNLMAVNTVEDGKKYQSVLQKKFAEFNDYFE